MLLRVYSTAWASMPVLGREGNTPLHDPTSLTSLAASLDTLLHALKCFCRRASSPRRAQQ